MSIERVRAYFGEIGIADRILEFSQSSATIELAAQALDVEPARIAKTLSFMVGRLRRSWCSRAMRELTTSASR